MAINQNIKEEEQEENGEVLSYCTYTVRTVQHSGGYGGGGVLGHRCSILAKSAVKVFTVIIF